MSNAKCFHADEFRPEIHQHYDRCLAKSPYVALHWRRDSQENSLDQNRSNTQKVDDVILGSRSPSGCQDYQSGKRKGMQEFVHWCKAPHICKMSISQTALHSQDAALSAVTNNNETPSSLSPMPSKQNLAPSPNKKKLPIISQMSRLGR